MGFAVRVRSAGQKYGPTCHQRDRPDVTGLSPWCDCRRLGSTLASWRWQDINVGNPLWRRALFDAKKMNVSAASLAPDSSVRKATPSDNTERTARSGAVVETIFLSRLLRAQCKIWPRIVHFEYGTTDTRAVHAQKQSFAASEWIKLIET